MRHAILLALLCFACTVALLTELLSLFRQLARGPLAIAWLVVIVAAIVFVLRRPRRTWTFPKLGLLDVGLVAGMAVIVSIVGFTALKSPPNSADAMAYHLPRVIYWAQSGTVRFFPTQYFNQIMLQPLAEYIMLHTYLLSGGDHFINLVQFFSFIGSIIGVSAVAALLGADLRGQILAAFFCATLPNGILQASGAKNDYLLALWLVLTLYFGLRHARTGSRLDGLAFGASVALALFTKATAYLFLPGVLIALGGVRIRRLGVTTVFLVLLLNGPQYFRNYQLSGSILGYDSAQGDGFFRWRNEHLGVRPMLSNLLRHFSEQVGDRHEVWNQGVYRWVLKAHDWIGADPNDPATTWPWAKFEPPRNANHEANANNRWHLSILFVGVCVLVWKRRNSLLLRYLGGILVAWLLFCFYLKWQPFLSRLQLPLFVLASAPAGLILARVRPALLQAVVCLFLLGNARLPLLENWTRPLRGPSSLLDTSRQSNYFADMGQWANRDSYFRAVEATLGSGCNEIGIDITRLQLEYPFQALVRERNSRARFQHVGVKNASARYQDPHLPPPCAVLCLDCEGKPESMHEYESIGKPLAIGRFLLLLKDGIP